MRSYLVKENPIGSVVSEILQYKLTNTQTNTQTSCYFSIRILGKKVQPGKIFEELYSFSRDFGQRGTYINAISGCVVSLKSQGKRGHLAVYYTSLQSFTITFSFR